MIKKIITYCIIFIPSFIFCQESINEFVISYHGKDIQQLSNEANLRASLRNEAAVQISPISPLSDNHLFHIITDVENNESWFEFFKSHRDINLIEKKTQLEWRNTRPNDPRLNDQWYLDNIRAFDAWSITNGGKDSSGRQVVIAVIDDGFMVGHEDFSNIFYQNKAENPSDNMDNDGNGYTDDFMGYNFVLGNGNITPERHGTNVIGVLGARGNNSIGISGLNWNVTILPIVIPSSSLGVEQALEYVYTMRKLYDATNGAKGAYIVAVTYSGGISKRFASSFPIWCGLYDKLGKAGILSIGATTNQNDNVDEVGDIPSTCPSEYLIVVTNSNKNDVKVRDAGYGPNHIDLAVPGDQILTTTNAANKYSFETGTSLSAPILAGAVSLLFSANCEAFHSFYDSKPDEAVLLIKRILMNSGDEAFYQNGNVNAPLDEVTVSGKRLNILNALDSLRVAFNDCIAGLIPKVPLTLYQVHVDFTKSAVLKFRTSSSQNIHLVVSDILGRVIFQEDITPQVDKTIYYPINLETNVGISAQYLVIGLSQGKEKVGKLLFYPR
ncbi:MAG: S8 family serine peptidase [Saprospiraceae bacterium]